MSEQTDVLERALAVAAGAGDHAGTSVLVAEDSQANLRWASGTLTTNGLATGRSVTVATAVTTGAGTAVGVVSRRGVGPDDVTDLVEAARAVARSSPPAEDAADLLDGGVGDDFGEAAVLCGPESLTDVAQGLGRALESARAQARELFGFAEQTTRTTWLGTTAGTRLRHVQPSGTVELTGKSHERSRSAFASRQVRDLAQVDVDALDSEVATRLGWQERRVDVDAGRWDTVLPPSAVADLMVYLYWSSDARSAVEGRSVFSRRGGGTRVGDTLTDVPLTLRSDPHHPGLECEPFVLTGASHDMASVFDNGVPSPATTWLDAGRIAALPTTRHTAALSGLPLHPPVDNLLLDSPDGTGDASDLARGLERGLLLTCLWYIREVDPTTLLLTGLTRDGVYLVEGGEVTGAVTNFRFNESPASMLARVAAVGAPVPALSREWGEWFPRTAMPPLLVRDFNMSSTSQAS